MVFEFRLPDIGEGIAEGEVVKWLVKEGEEVRENQPLVEIMTDKVNVEIPSPKKGTVLRLMAKEGDVVKVGQTLLVIGEKGEQKVAATSTHLTVEAPISAPAEAERATSAPLTGAAKRPQEVLATPATRKLARDLGVDLALLQGTGPAGRITEEDVQQFKKSEARAVTVGVPKLGKPGREERIPLRGIRRKIAERMVKSKHTAAHVTHVDEVDMTEIVQLREKGKMSAEKKGMKLTYLPFIIKALIPALKQFPYVNATLDDASDEIILKNYYNIGIATNTEQGLIVPVVKDADRKSLAQLADEIARLSERARAGELTLDEIQNSTFTITNVGSIGGVFATPIINYPEVAILGVHKITRRPVVRDNQIVIRDMTYLSMSFDHRVLDGALAAEFMNVIKQYLEDPKLLLLETD